MKFLIIDHFNVEVSDERVVFTNQRSGVKFTVRVVNGSTTFTVNDYRLGQKYHTGVPLEEYVDVDSISTRFDDLHNIEQYKQNTVINVFPSELLVHSDKLNSVVSLDSSALFNCVDVFNGVGTVDVPNVVEFGTFSQDEINWMLSQGLNPVQLEVVSCKDGLMTVNYSSFDPLLLNRMYLSDFLDDKTASLIETFKKYRVLT